MNGRFRKALMITAAVSGIAATSAFANKASSEQIIKPIIEQKQQKKNNRYEALIVALAAANMVVFTYICKRRKGDW